MERALLDSLEQKRIEYHQPKDKNIVEQISLSHHSLGISLYDDEEIIQ